MTTESQLDAAHENVPVTGLPPGLLGVASSTLRVLLGEGQTDPRGTLPTKPTASTGQGGDLARRRFQHGQLIFSKSRQMWLGRYREDTIRADGSIIRTRPQVLLGTIKDLPTQRLAHRKLDEILSRINDYSYQPTRISTVADFAARWGKINTQARITTTRIPDAA